MEVDSSNLCRFRPLYHIRQTTTTRKALGLTPFRNIELVNSTVSLGKNVVQRQSNYHRAMKTLSSTGNADILAPRRILDASSANLRSNIDIAEHATCSKQESSNYERECCWTWDSDSMSGSITLGNQDEVLFHPDYSCGTAAIRGEEPFELGSQHYWEIKMTSAVYGTDMMIGLGSSAVDLDNSRTAFASLLGLDPESWGLSYLGTIQHRGEMKQFTTKLERDDVVGLHLDMWHGTLSIYNQGKPCGIAFRGLQNKELYPMLSSTAARTRMKLERSCSLPTTLQYLCCAKIGSHISGLHDLDKLPLPPGMKRYLGKHMAWVLQTKSSRISK